MRINKKVTMSDTAIRRAVLQDRINTLSRVAFLLTDMNPVRVYNALQQEIKVCADSIRALRERRRDSASQ